MYRQSSRRYILEKYIEEIEDGWFQKQEECGRVFEEIEDERDIESDYIQLQRRDVHVGHSRCPMSGGYKVDWFGCRIVGQKFRIQKHEKQWNNEHQETKSEW